LTFDTEQNLMSIEIPKDGLTLNPSKVYLGTTYEKIGSTDFVTTLLGRSSMGRLGLYLNITADLGHVGSFSNWTLEIHCVQPIRVYPRMVVGQVAFWHTSGTRVPYAGRYAYDEAPIPSRDFGMEWHPINSDKGGAQSEDP
ncbi:MAG: hypothetical protein M9953_12920, partial [Thermomicrobiales bacterium]|nr:hypothetical protein [Thermomicrobiales bacterium]